MREKILHIIKENKAFFFFTSVILLLLTIIIIQSPYVGHGEMAHYVLEAGTLIQGRGYMLDYIPNFYNVKLLQGSEISHKDDFFAIGHSTLIALFFLFFGESIFVAKFVNVVLLFIFSCLAYFLIKKLYDKSIAFFTVLFTLTSIEIFGTAAWPHSDTGFLFFINLSLVFMYLFLQTKKRWHLFFLSLFTALAVYFKQSGILLIPTFFLVLTYYILKKEMQMKYALRYALYFALLVFVFISPIFVREYMNYDRIGFGLEVHSSMLKYQPWEEAYALYDSEEDLPSIFPIETYGLWHMLRIDIRHIFLTLQSFFLDQPVSAVILFLAVLQLFLLRKEDISLLIPYLSFSCFFFLFALFVWFFEIRYYIILFPVIYFLATLCLFRTIKPLFVNNNAWILFLVLFLGITMFPFVNNYYFVLKGNPNEQALVDGFLWIKENAHENAIIMTRNPSDLTVHTGRQSIAIPYADYNRTMALIGKYNITYIEISFTDTTSKALAEMDPDLIIRQQFRELYLGQNTADFTRVYSNDLVYIFQRNI